MKIIEEKIKNWLKLYDEYLIDQFEYPDEAKSEYSTFITEKNEILKQFGLPNKKPCTSILFQIINDNLYEKKIAGNLFQLSIYNSSKVSKQIILTMKKLEQVIPYLSKMDILFGEFYGKFEKSPLVNKEQLHNVAGIYVFYKNRQPIYVGRTDKIKQRIQDHTRPSSRSGSATFAFNLAKGEYIKNYGEIKLTRNDLEKDEKFNKIFIDKKKYLSDCVFKILPLENDILQAMFEPYLAVKLGTYPINNTFENH